MNGKQIKTLMFKFSARLILISFFLSAVFFSVQAAEKNDGSDVELVYDNGQPTLSIGFDQTTGDVLVTRFTPPQFPAKILRARYFLSDTTGGSAFSFSILDNVGDYPSIEIYGPVTLRGKEMGWNEIDLSGENITVTDDFYFVFGKTGNSLPKFGAEDLDPFANRTYDTDC